MKTWELCGHALALVWFRPQLLLALVPLLSALVIEGVLDGFGRRRLTGFAFACAMAFAGEKLWTLEASALHDAQREVQRLAEQAQLEGRDPNVLELQFGRPAVGKAVAKAEAAKRTRLAAYREAIPWAWGIARANYGVLLFALAFMIAIAWSLDKRFGMAAGVLLLTPLTFIVGSGEFALQFPSYQSIPDSLRRLLIVVSPMTAAFAVVLEDKVFHAAKQAETVPDQVIPAASSAGPLLALKQPHGFPAPAEATALPKRVTGKRGRKRR